MGVTAVHVGDSFSTLGDTFSTVEVVQYSGDNISTVGDSFSTVGDTFSTVEVPELISLRNQIDHITGLDC